MGDGQRDESKVPRQTPGSGHARRGGGLGLVVGGVRTSHWRSVAYTLGS
jgi:hypothetical protein